MASDISNKIKLINDAKIEIAEAITEVGAPLNIKAYPHEVFRDYADKIRSIGHSIWSSADDSQEQHLTITENGYYDINELSKKYFDDPDKYNAASSFYINVQSAPVEIGEKCLWIGDAEEIEIARPEPLVRGSDYATYDAFIDAVAAALNATKTIVTISYTDYYRIECPNGAVMFAFTDEHFDREFGPYPGGKFINSTDHWYNSAIYGDQNMLIFVAYDATSSDKYSGGLAIYSDSIGANKGSLFEHTYYNMYIDDMSGADIHNSIWDHWVPANHSSYRIGRNTLSTTVYYSFDKQYGRIMTDALASKFEIGMSYISDELPPSVGVTVDLGEYALYLGDYWHLHDHKYLYDISGLSIDGARFARISGGLFKRVT